MYNCCGHNIVVAMVVYIFKSGGWGVGLIASCTAAPAPTVQQRASVTPPPARRRARADVTLPLEFERIRRIIGAKS